MRPGSWIKVRTLWRGRLIDCQLRSAKSSEKKFRLDTPVLSYEGELVDGIAVLTPEINGDHLFWFFLVLLALCTSATIHQLTRTIPVTQVSDPEERSVELLAPVVEAPPQIVPEPVNEPAVVAPAPIAKPTPAPFKIKQAPKVENDLSDLGESLSAMGTKTRAKAVPLDPLAAASSLGSQSIGKLQLAKTDNLKGQGMGEFTVSSEKSLQQNTGRRHSTGEAGLESSSIATVVEAHRRRILLCFEDQLPLHPGLSGQLLVQFAIGGSGRVRSARIEKSTFNIPRLHQCLAREVQTWQFPPPSGGGEVTVRYPFSFQAR